MRRLEVSRSRRRSRSSFREPATRADRWMISYADLVTLLLAVFIVLFMSDRMEQSREAEVGLRASFVPSLAASTDVAAAAEEATAVETPAASFVAAPNASSFGDEMARVETLVEAYVAEAGLDERVQTRVERRGLVVSLVEAGFFEAGRAVPRDDAVPVIDALGRLFASSQHQIRVEGHTDDTPIRTARFPSNWELSTARATWLVAHFAERFRLSPERLSAAGYGEFRPIASNGDAEGRASNRRVDIVLLAPDIAAAEEPAFTPTER